MKRGWKMDGVNTRMEDGGKTATAVILSAAKDLVGNRGPIRSSQILQSLSLHQDDVAATFHPLSSILVFDERRLQ